MIKPLPDIDLKTLRNKLGLTQKAFAETYHISCESIRNWEQKKRVPKDPTKVLLFLIDETPNEIAETLKKLENS